MVHQGLNATPIAATIAADGAVVDPARRRLGAALGAAVLAPWLGSCALLGTGERPPPVPREFRAAWVASVAHIDWPSRPGLDTAAQRAELQAVVAQAAALGLNALVLQVRPTADALYASAIEPWSEYLTGASGRAPDEPWDPLAEWVAAAHAAGLELHAWFNPYRARHPSARSEPAPGHVARAEPAIVRTYGDQLWMDPAEPRAAERTRAVVRDVVQRYDIDGVHVDDYFYPYPVSDGQGGERPFPDDEAWQRHLAAGGRLSRADWRRDQVDRLIEALADDIHRSKPWVRFGISPFGLPRPDRRPPGVTGFSQYDKLYADVERWLAEGWMDYLAPQLYWPVDSPGQPFAVLDQAWRALNPRGRHLWPGLFTSRIGAERNAYRADEVLAQVALTRHEGSPANGHLHFSWVALGANRDGVADRLRREAYAEPALPPATPWLIEPAPAPPQPRLAPAAGAAPRLRAEAAPGAPVRQVVLWRREAGAWRWTSLSAARAATEGFAWDGAPVPAWLVAVGRTGLESAPVRVAP